MSNTTNRSYRNTPQALIDEFLEKGGEVNVCEAGAKTENVNYVGGFYAKKKKAKDGEKFNE
jgi:predicted peroxiredoxin|tara:strand:+ start:1308 stop:1490 length:183 start_codon:yes stop_codon:yes gene_type:complete